MIRYFLIFATILLLSSQKDGPNAGANDKPRPAEFKMLPEENRSVILATTPQGHAFHFMPIYEPGVTDITITIAWPSDWAYEASLNPAVPYIGAETLLSGGTEAISPKELNEFYLTEIQADRSFPRRTTYMAKSTFQKNTEKTSLTLLEMRCAGYNSIQVGFHRVKGIIRQNMQSGHLKTETKMWNLARKANWGDSPQYHFLTLPDLAVIDDVSVDMLR